MPKWVSMLNDTVLLLWYFGVRTCQGTHIIASLCLPVNAPARWGAAWPSWGMLSPHSHFFLFHTLTFFLLYTLTILLHILTFHSLVLFGFFSFCFSLFLLGAMMVSSPWSSWGTLSPHSHFFPFTLSLFCFTPSLLIYLFCLPSSLWISFQYLFTLIFYSSSSIYIQSLNWFPLKLGHIEEIEAISPLFLWSCLI